jgi:multiple sugar transport system substrate-binding protein
MTELTGITWNHTRGYLPMVATAQRFNEQFPEVHVRWDKRSLQQFADWPIQKLAERYDLLVIDHPFSGYAAAHDVLVPLDCHLPEEFLADQAVNSVGASHASYQYGGHQWALAIDTATPVCGIRADLLREAGVTVPGDWPSLMDLARRGMVAVPGIPIDSLMNFYMLCGALGEEPFQSNETVVSEPIACEALGMLRELIQACDPGCLERNPIATWDLLAGSGTAALCPFAYGYSNYARRGYASYRLEFTGLVTVNGRRCRSTLGGAGLAVSSRCRHLEEALRYCQFVASPACQATLYFDSGGQPGHRAAWLDAEVNARSNHFFADTLATLDDAWLRPRYNGYLDFQDRAAPVVHAFLRTEMEAAKVLDKLNRIYRESHETT